MSTKLSVEQIKAVAEAAITARQKASDAKKAADEAGGADEALNNAAAQAEKEATEAVQKAEALSQQPAAGDDPENARKRAKLKRKQGIIAQQLKDLGEDPDE